MIPLRLLIFGVTVNSIWIGVTIYLYRRLTQPFDLSRRARVAARLLAGAVALIVPSAFLTRLVRSWPGQETVAFIGFATLGMVGILAVLIIVRDLLMFVGARLHPLLDKPPLDEGRRRFLMRASTAGLTATAGGLAAAGLHGAQQAPQVERVTVTVKGLHTDLVGLRIVQISDLHVGATSRADAMTRVAEQVNALEPDLIAVTGDLVDGPVSVLAPEVEPLFAMSAPMGVHFCTGNHEYYAGWKPWCDLLQQRGWQVLINRHEMRQKGTGKLLIAGIPDNRAERFEPDHKCDLEGACAGAGPADFRLLLAHQPRSMKNVPSGSFDLVVSGHTHGGQFFPFTVLVHLFQPLVAGLYRQKGMWVYVNRGTTHWGPPLRFGSRQEITLIELQRG
jgi:uncharacterized protein